MSLKITLSEDGKYIIGKVDEPISREIAQLMAKEYVKLIKSTGIKRILNDVRGAQDVMGVVQDYEYTHTDIQVIELPHDIRSAIVADVDDTSHDFAETVASNAGYLVKVFHSIESAVAWLMENNI